MTILAEQVVAVTRKRCAAMTEFTVVHQAHHVISNRRFAKDQAFSLPKLSLYWQSHQQNRKNNSPAAFTKNFAALAAVAAVGLTPEQWAVIFDAFLDASELKPYIPDFGDCTGNSTAIIVSLNAAISDFSKANKTYEDIADGIEQIGIAVQGIANITLSCKKLPETLGQLVNYVMKIINDPSKWFKLVSENTTKNSIWIMMNLYALDGLIKSGDYKGIGTKLGEVFKWTLKVDLGSALRKLSSGFKIGGTPTPEHIADCVKSLSPIVLDIYNAITLYLKGDTDGAMKAITALGIDAIGAGATCYKVIQDIIG